MLIRLHKIIAMAGKAIHNPRRVVQHGKKFIGKHARIVGNGEWAPLPSTIKLYVNARCNARCVMCDIGKKSDTMFSRVCTTDGSDMPLELYEKIVDEVKSFASVLNIAGVEPLLHKDIMTMVRYAKTNKLRVVLNTNGLLLEEYAEELAHTNIESLQVSLDGMEDIHDRVRGVPGAFVATLAGLRALRQCNPGIHIQVNCCINDINQGQLSPLLRFLLSERLADRVSFIHPYFVTDQAAGEFMGMYPDLGTATAVGLTQTQLQQIDSRVLFHELQRVKELYAEYGVRWEDRFGDFETLNTYYHDPETRLNSKVCPVPWTVGMIFSTGECGILNRCLPYRTGNVKTMTFREIWYGEKYKAFRRVLQQTGGFSVCKRCCGVV